MTKFATLADESVQHIPVVECGEPLIHIQESLHGVVLDRSVQNERHLGYSPDFRLRLSVASHLARAHEYLPSGISFLIKECFRPVAVQTRYFTKYQEKLRLRHPTMDQQSLYRRAAMYVAPPECATHVTGGAFDLILVDSNGVPLDMGTPYDAAPDECNNACFTDSPHISDGARLLRTVLKQALEAVGFVNYPFEWWHWSYGDKYWAFVTGSNSSLYGPLA